MTAAIPSAPNTEESYPGLYRQMGIYAPFVWLAVMALRLGLRAGFISPEFLMPSRPEITPQLMHRNRQLRRARESCLARARRHALRGRKINPENYTPRAYAHYTYVNMMDKTISPGQFMERYIRDNDLSRVQVYGLDRADRIMSFTHCQLKTLLAVIVKHTGRLRLSSFSVAALSVPAPP